MVFLQNIKVNWVDVVVLLLIMRSIYMGARDGLTMELFKFLGVLTGLVVALHLYNKAADIFIANFNLPQWLCESLSFIVITQIIRLIFTYGIAMILKIMSIQFLPQLEKLGGGILGFARGFILSGTLLVMLILLPSAYLDSSIYDKSLSGKFIIKACEKTYKSFTFWLPEESTKKEIFG